MDSATTAAPAATTPGGPALSMTCAALASLLSVEEDGAAAETFLSAEDEEKAPGSDSSRSATSSTIEEEEEETGATFPSCCSAISGCCAFLTLAGLFTLISIEYDEQNDVEKGKEDETRRRKNQEIVTRTVPSHSLGPFHLFLLSLVIVFFWLSSRCNVLSSVTSAP